MQNTFEIGDRVRVLRKGKDGTCGHRFPAEGVILSVCSSHWGDFEIKLDQQGNGFDPTHFADLSDIELIGPKTDVFYSIPTTGDDFIALYAAHQYKPKTSLKMKITAAFKKFLSADLQTQIKAGYRDEGLNLTSAGKDAAIEALLDATPAAQAAFTAAATEIVAEQSKQS